MMSLTTDTFVLAGQYRQGYMERISREAPTEIFQFTGTTKDSCKTVKRFTNFRQKNHEQDRVVEKEDA